MGAFRGHVNLRPRRPLAGRVARWYAGRELANAMRRPVGASPLSTAMSSSGQRLHAASASAMSGLVRPIPRP